MPSLDFDKVFGEEFFKSVDAIKTLPEDLWTDVLSKLITMRLTESSRGFSLTEEIEGQISELLDRLTLVELPIRGIKILELRTSFDTSTLRLQ